MAAQTRDRILDSARRLSARRGAAALSVDEVVSQARVSRATFYRLFGSRNQLLEELGVEPDPAARDRVMQATGEMLATQGLAAL